VSSADVADMSRDVTASLTRGLKVLTRAHALNPLKLNTLESLLIAYDFVKKPELVAATEEKIKSLHERYPDLPVSVPQ
jgi:hypothetical protein